MWARTKTAAAALDNADELARLRGRYNLPREVIRLDGSSGGSLSRTTPARLRKFVEHRWDSGTARPRTSGEGQAAARCAAACLAPLIGADPAEITVAESTSMHLFTALLAAAQLRPERPVLVVGQDCFATDRYLARSAAEFSGGELLLLDSADDLATVLDKRVAVVVLSHTDLISGEVRNPAEINAEVHRNGALTLWDLSYSAGALDVNLHAWHADFAIGCGYKYLGGGAGAPAYCYAAERHHADLRAHSIEPPCYSRYQGMVSPLNGGLPGALSTPSMSGFLAGLSILDGASPAALEAKTTRLTEVFLERLRESGAAEEREIIAPPKGKRRGSQVCLQHPAAQQATQELCARGVIADFAEPDLLRFSFAPAWLRYVDVWEAAELLHGVLADLSQRV